MVSRAVLPVAGGSSGRQDLLEGAAHRANRRTGARQQAGKDWHRAMETEEFAASFTAAMDCRGLYLAQSVAPAVDLRQHGICSTSPAAQGSTPASLVAHNPHLRATVLEKPPVDRIAAARHREARISATACRSSRATCSSIRCRRRRRPSLLERAARLGRARGRAAAAQVLRRTACRRAGHRPRGLPQCREDRTAACCGVLGAADARLGRAVLLGRGDGGATCLRPAFRVRVRPGSAARGIMTARK